MILKFFNTLGRKTETFTPQRKASVSFYTCGPTIYDIPHLGNLRTFVTSDLVRRVLERADYLVRQIINLTDVDDKTIKGSREAGLSLSEFTKPYEINFLAAICELNIKEPTAVLRATDFVPQMISLIELLLKRGAAYQAEDGVYFKINSFPAYGQLAKLPANLKSESRINNDDYDKESAVDFALWKFERPEDNGATWEASFGRGRPGWHLECSAIIKAALEETIDIHLGGTDLIFPHHENEIAQSEIANGVPLARFWIHSAFINIQKEKMAKSIGNVICLPELEKRGFSPLDFRYLVLTVHYRTSLNFSWKSLAAAASARGKLNQAVRELAVANGEGQILIPYRQRFDEALGDDLNLPRALALVWELLKDDKNKRRDKLATLLDFDHVLGLSLPVAIQPLEIPETVKQLLNEREEARKREDWATSDRLRAEIAAAGYALEDTPNGPKLVFIPPSSTSHPL